MEWQGLCEQAARMARALIPLRILRRIAVAADADPRTVRKVLLGGPLDHPARRRIASAVKRLGLPYELNDEEDFGDLPAA